MKILEIEKNEIDGWAEFIKVSFSIPYTQWLEFKKTKTFKKLKKYDPEYDDSIIYTITGNLYPREVKMSFVMASLDWYKFGRSKTFRNLLISLAGSEMLHNRSDFQEEKG